MVLLSTDMWDVFGDEPAKKGVRICCLACGTDGAPYTVKVWADYTEMEQVLAGKNRHYIKQNALVCRASTLFAGDTYTLVAFGVVAKPDAEKDVLSAWDFRRLTSNYTGKAGAEYDTYIIKHKAGELLSFVQGKDDPFLNAFCL
jgi:hypothetical protein